MKNKRKKNKKKLKNIINSGKNLENQLKWVSLKTVITGTN